MPQEANMAELLRLMQNMIVRFDDLDGKVDDLATRYEGCEDEFVAS
jgi:hypothetical protein